MNQPSFRGRNLGPSLLVAVAVLAFAVPGLFAQPRTSPATPIFPETVAPYSWWTSHLSSSRMEAATMLYQNGVGVEAMDFPQAVLLGADGSTYRRLDLAERRSAPGDQGDPAQSVLSPDGTFVVVGGPSGQGTVRLTRLGDGSEQEFSVGEGRSVVPVSIGADGRSVLLITGDTELSPLSDLNFQLHGQLARLDLDTGTLVTYRGLADVHSAALSPDGSRMLVDIGPGLVLADARTGSVLASVPLADQMQPNLDGDAFSPDGSRAALMVGTTLVVVDPAEPTQYSHFPIETADSGVAIGWRDETTVLIHIGTGEDANTSQFGWVDTNTGALEVFSNYAPGFTGASLLRADAARGLVAQWQVAATPTDQGQHLGIGWLALLAALAGLITFSLTPRQPSKLREPVKVADLH